MLVCRWAHDSFVLLYDLFGESTPTATIILGNRCKKLTNLSLPLDQAFHKVLWHYVNLFRHAFVYELRTHCYVPPLPNLCESSTPFMFITFGDVLLTVRQTDKQMDRCSGVINTKGNKTKTNKKNWFLAGEVFGLYSFFHVKAPCNMSFSHK